MTYSGSFKINKKDLDYYNKLLQVDLDKYSLCYNENDITYLNVKKDDYIDIACVEFENGNYVTIDILSGDSNYYDNIILWDKNGNELVCSDCNYTIDSISLYYDEDIYDIKIEIEV